MFNIETKENIIMHMMKRFENKTKISKTKI